MFDPRNILVIDFGQLGDVVLSLPALRAIREKFPQARITVAVGKPGAGVVDLAGCADATLVVDRVALRDGLKVLSIARIVKLVKDVRQRKFDFVIDLHSFAETNVLGFLSGASKRLYSRRPGRSLDILANFSPRPPIEDNSPKKHFVDRYLDVLRPLGIKEVSRVPRLTPRPVDDSAVAAMLRKANADTGAPLIGLFPGAGHPSRCWPIEKFAELADYFVRNDGLRVVLFLGPEETKLRGKLGGMFPASTVILDRLTLPQLVAAQARLAVFISNDTGPMHVAAAVGTAVVVLVNRQTPDGFVPVEERQRVIYSRAITEISPDRVYTAARELLLSNRMDRIVSASRQ